AGAPEHWARSGGFGVTPHQENWQPSRQAEGNKSKESRCMTHSGPRTSPSSTEHPTAAPASHLRDFTTTWRVLPISALAIVIGVVAAYVAVILLRLIGFCTNLF